MLILGKLDILMYILKKNVPQNIDLAIKFDDNRSNTMIEDFIKKNEWCYRVSS